MVLMEQVSANGSVQDKAKGDPNHLFDTPSTFMTFLQIPTIADDMPPWSIYPARRDAALRNFWKSEPILSGAVYSIQARIRALEYNISSMYKAREEYYNNLMELADFGEGFETFIGKTVVDLLTQDNGAFWEIIGAGSPTGPLIGPPQRLVHMDSAACWRTFDREYPVIYVSPQTGKYHRLHKTRVAPLSLMPQPNELARGIGFSAVSRALRAVQIMKAIQIFKFEKITGSRPGIGFGNGFTQKQFGGAIAAAENEDASSGTLMWKRVPFVINPDSTAKVDMEILSLSGLPDGFDAVDDTTLYVYALALAFGVDAREFWPATSSGATKADATIQHLKARGKGIGDIIQTIQRSFYRYVLPADKSVKFSFDYTDEEEDRVNANLDKVMVDMFTSMVNEQVITPQEMRLSMLSKGILDERLIDKDTPKGEFLERARPPDEKEPEVITGAEADQI